MKKNLASKIKKIKCLILDVDGVLTDGKIILDHQGQEIKEFDVQDGFGLVLIKRSGIKTAILSARSAPCVTARAQDLKLDMICQDASPKLSKYEEILKTFNLKDENVCFIGDDLPDLQVLKRVGFSVSVPNGRAEVKKQVDYLTQAGGGRGAVREIVELILKTQGQWDKVLKSYA